jgi:hypothetical protein
VEKPGDGKNLGTSMIGKSQRETEVPLDSAGYVLPQQVKVDRSIGIAIQDEPPPVPTLRHMVWDFNGNHPSESSHDRKTISGITPLPLHDLYAILVPAGSLAATSTKMKRR